MSSRSFVALLVAVSLAGVAGCSSNTSASSDATAVVATGGGSLASSTLPPVAGSTDGTDAAATSQEPRVDLIGVAIAAVEQRLGGPQAYFEVNATSTLVNVIVALNDATLAQTWLYLDGELSSQEPQKAAGDTFTAADLTFDPATVLAKVATDLPGSALDLFFATAPGGTVQYRLVVTSQAGGQLIVQLAADGEVLEVAADTE